jgi:hypothetical protein
MTQILLKPYEAGSTLIVRSVLSAVTLEVALVGTGAG